MSTRFVILCLGRTGSSHLVSLLDSHPRIRCHGELLGAGAPEGADPVEAARATLRSGEAEAVGFKLPMNSLREVPRAAALVAGDPELRVIRLSRRDHLALLVSRRLVAATGVTQSIYGDYGEARVEIEPEGALHALDGIAAEEAELDELAAGHAVARIDYEELVAGERLDELQRFLEVEPAELRSWFRRLRTKPLAEVVSNWDELAAALRGTRWAQS